MAGPGRLGAEVDAARTGTPAVRATNVAARRSLPTQVRPTAGRGRLAALARAVAAGAPVSNRAVSQMVMRDIGAYWAQVADDPSYATEAASAEPPAQPESEELPPGLGGKFRAEIRKALEQFAGAPAVEGTAAFDEFLTPATVRRERATTVGWTSCITTLTKIFYDAADAINKELGVKVQTTKKGNLVGGMYGAVKFAANSEAEQRASAVEAWIAWPGPDKDHRHPKPGDILVLHKPSGEFGHVGFFYSWGEGQGDTEIWTTIDGGQGTKGEWIKGVYKEGSGKQEIKRRDRKYWSNGDIEGEPGQGATLKVRGWVNIEKLVLEAAKQG
jgi:hypothetical protein